MTTVHQWCWVWGASMSLRRQFFFHRMQGIGGHVIQGVLEIPCLFDRKWETECYECPRKCLRDMCGLWGRLREMTLDLIWIAEIFIIRNLMSSFQHTFSYFLAACSFTDLQHIYSLRRGIVIERHNSLQAYFAATASSRRLADQKHLLAYLLI